MTILTPVEATQSLNLFLREEDVQVVEFTQDGQYTSFLPTIENIAYTTGSYTTIDVSFSEGKLQEGTFYSIKVKNAGNRDIFRGKAFVTGQATGSYSINSGSYIEGDNTDTDYIIL